MELSSLLSGVDNLFKFLFIGGIVMILTSLFYPLQKEQELDIEVNTYNKEVKLLNKDLDVLNSDIKKAHLSSKSTEQKLLALSKLRKLTISKLKSKALEDQIAVIKVVFKRNVDSLKRQERVMETKVIILEYNKTKIDLLNKYAKSYESYTCKLSFWGIAFLITGLLGWIYSTINSERLKLKELKRP